MTAEEKEQNRKIKKLAKLLESKYKVNELKEMCRKNAQPQTGTKSELANSLFMNDDDIDSFIRNC